MKRFPQRLAMILAALLCATMVACTETPTPGASNSTNAPTTAATEKPADASEATEAPATGDAETQSDFADKMTITVANWDVEKSFPTDREMDKIGKTIMDKFNVEFEAMPITWGDYMDRYNVWASSGSMPDICGGIDIIGTGKYYQWVEEGVVRELPDLTPYENINKYIGLPEVTAYLVDGKNYMLPRMTYSDPNWWCMDRGILYRKDWVKNLGLKEPTSAQEFIDLCVAMAKNDPDQNGANDTMGMTLTNVTIMSQFFQNFGDTGSAWMKVGDKYVQNVFEEVSIPVADMMRKAYNAGGVDPDFSTYTSPDVPQEIFASGRAGIYSRQVSPKHVKQVYDKWMELQPDKNFFECVGILPLWPEAGKDTVMFSEKSYWSESYLGGQVDDAKAQRILQIYDYLYSDEGMKYLSYGEEGVDYKMEGDQIVSLLPLKENGQPKGMGDPDMYPFTFSFGYLAAWNGDMLQYINPTIPDEILNMCIAERDNRMKNWKKATIDWDVQALNVPEKQEMTARSGDLWNVVIMDGSSKTTEELYQTLRETAKGQGYDACVEAVTKAAAEKLGK